MQWLVLLLTITTSMALCWSRTTVHVCRVLTILLMVCSTGVQSSGKTFFENLLLEDSFGEAECDAIVQEVAAAERKISVDEFPRLPGTWVSQDCENRAGPSFLLRRLHISTNQSFRFITTFYSDSSCTVPSYTISARGQISIDGIRLLSPGVGEGSVDLERLSIIPHTQQMASELFQTIKEACAHFPHSSWRRHREYLLVENNHPKCESEFAEVAELDLVKTQSRVLEGRETKELFLGSVRNRRPFKLLETTTMFFPPLLRVDMRHGCPKCRTIARGTPHSPPHLMAQAHLPPLLSGEWVSQRCEVHALGVTFSRRMTFSEDDRSWSLQVDFFSDNACTKPVFHARLDGVYTKGTLNDRSNVVDGASNLDLSLLKLRLKGKEDVSTNCLVENSDEKSCLPWGLHVPSTLLTIVKLEIGSQGTPLLHVGHLHHGKRSTWYQTPLVQCSTMPLKPQALQQSMPSSATTLKFLLLSKFLVLALSVFFIV